MDTKPILRDFPQQIETERLLIRCPLPGDGAALATAVNESIHELRPWLDWATQELTAADSEANVRRGYARFINREDLWLLLLLKENQTIIGGSGLHRIDWDVPKFEIGYWLHTAYTGQGYMTEAVAAISQFAFETLNARRVEIRCDARNERSTAVAQRLNFTLEGILRQEKRHHLDNSLRDTMIFAKIAPDA